MKMNFLNTSKKSKRGTLLLQLFLAIFVSTVLLESCKTEEPIAVVDNDDTDSTDTTDSVGVVDDGVTVLDTSEVDASMIYIPNELSSNNFYKSTSQWYYGRSKQSDHFIVFWDREYEDNDPNSEEIDEVYRVDIEDLLEKAEGFYEENIEILKFAEVGEGKSKLDDYKMMIFIYYQTEWLATGSGYDNTIGALWVNPGTCHPVGSTIAHEIGHSFQYQVFCDLGESTGYRYGFGGNGGNAFWEQCAQWQSFQSYPMEAFTSYNFEVYTENYHRSIFHEWQRYASYWIHYYWTDKHGIDMIGRLWRNSIEPEDPAETYMRITGISTSQFNDEIYDAATKFVTWDLDAIRDNGENYIGAHTFNSIQLSDGSYQVSYDRCPGTTGYNVIRLNVPSAGTEVSTLFTGMVNAEGYNTIDDEKRAGWRYGYVALLTDGTRVYGDMNRGTSKTVSFTVPEGTSKLWFVVTGAPNSYEAHPWDENEANDDQWPYKVKFTNTDLYGNITFDGTEIPHDLDLSYDISFAVSDSDYAGTTVDASNNVVEIANAFVLQPSEIAGLMSSGEIKFYAVESDGTLNAETTANGYGHWFDASGDVVAWGDDAVVYSEFDESNLAFNVGQYPGHNASGDQHTIKQALVYDNGTDGPVQITFEFNITLN